MANKNHGKSSAERYREERKARLAAASKKNAKNSAKKVKSRRIVKATVACVVALAIVLGIGSYIFSSLGYTQRMRKVITVGNESFSEAEYVYHYLSVYSYIAQQCYSIDQQYGSGTAASYYGFDYLQSPAKQEYKGDDVEVKEGETFTWADYFDMNAVKKLQTVKAQLDEAKKANLELTQEELDKIKEDIENLRKTATEQQMSLNSYLKKTYGKGTSESYLKKVLKATALAEKFANYKMDEFEASYSIEKLEAKYKENPNAFDSANIRIFLVEPEAAKTAENATQEEKTAAQEKAKKAAKEKAAKMLSEITDEQSFISLSLKYANEEDKKYYEDKDYSLLKNISYDAMESSIDKDAAKWLFDSARKAGDKNIYEATNGIYIIYVLNPRFRDDTNQPVDVRHILVKFDEKLEGAEAEASKKKKLTEAQAILDSWKSGEATEATFITLAKEKSEDTGSAESGGLIADIYKDSSYVQPFKDWCYEAGRKVGDTGIVETTYGYHVMYCSEVSDRPKWQGSILSDFLYDDIEKFNEELLAKDEYKVILNDKSIVKAKDSALEVVLGFVKAFQANNFAQNNIVTVPYSSEAEK